MFSFFRSHYFRGLAVALLAAFSGICGVVLMTETVAHAQSGRISLAMSCPLQTERVYRAPVITTVFYITSDCQKRPIFNPDVYFSYYADWTPVVFVEQPQLDAVPDHPLRFMPWGPRRTFQNGSLIKTTDDPHVFLIEDGKAYPFGTEEAFKAFGFTFDMVEDVSRDSMEKFQKQSQEILNLDQIPFSVVFKYLSSPHVYIIVNDEGTMRKRRIGSMEELRQIARADRIATFPDTKVFLDGEGNSSLNSSSNASVVPLQFSFNLSEATSTISGTFKLQVVPVNNASITSVKYLLGSTTLAVITSSPFTYSLNTASYANGSNVVTAVVFGENGEVKTVVRPMNIQNVVEGGGGGGGASGGGGSGGTGNSGSSGNSNTGSTEDTTAPVVTTFVLPSSAQSLSISVSSFIASDAVGVTGYLLTESTSTPSASDVGWSTSVPTLYLFSTGGTKTLYAWAKDAKGNVSASKNASIVVGDTTAPVISSIASSTSATTATITWTTNEAATSTVEFGVTSSYGSVSSSAVSVLAHSVVLSGLTNNTVYHFRVSSQDVSGNRSTSQDYVFKTLDVTIPTITSFTLPSSSNSRTVSITSFTATDNAGITGYYLSESPAAPLASTGGWSVTPSSSYVFSSDGSKTLYAWAKDAQGNVSPSASASVMVDTIAPVISSIASSTSATTATITWTTNEAATSFLQYGPSVSYSDASSSAVSVTSHTIVLTGLASDTLYHFRISSQDAVGNQTNTIDRTFKTIAVSDTTAPTVALTTPSAGATISGSSVSLQATASDNAFVSSVVFKIDATTIASDALSPFTATLNSTQYTNGTHTLSAVAFDSSGNAATSTITVQISNAAADTTAPTVTAFSIPSVSNSRTVSITSFTATDNTGVTGYLVTESSIAPASDATGWSASAPSSYGFSSDGLKTLYAWAKDALGNVSLSSAATVTVDTVSPTVSITSPAGGAVVSGTLAITATASDNFSVSSVSFRIDGSVISGDVSNPYTASLNTTLYTDGAHTLSAIATDGAGNAASNSISVTILNATDTTAPVISSVASSTAQTSATITWTTNENSTSTVEYGLTTSYGASSSSQSLVTSHSVVLTGLSADTLYHFRVKSRDAAGNMASSTDYTFRTGGAVVSASMPRIGIGRPSYSNQGNASLVNDGGYRAPNAWAFSGCSATSPCWAAIDVGTGPQKVLAQWSYEDGDISFNSVTFWGHIGNVVKNYALYVSADSTNGVDGTWVPATDDYSAQPVDVTGNTFLYRAHVIRFTGYRWIKIAITSSTAENIDELELWDATASTDDTFFFHGDSNTASASQHGTHPDHGQQPSFQTIINTSDPTRYPMMTGGGNIAHSTWEVVEEIPVYLAMFPMTKYWFNIMGTNDSCYVSASQYQTNLQTWIDAVKAAGRIPILTHVLWGNGVNCDANIPALNSAIDALIATNNLLPAVPLYERTQNHPEWFQSGDVHVNAEGRLVWNDVFADYVMTELGSSASTSSDTTPPVISAVASSTTQTSATISWTTNEYSTSTVEYGATASYGASVSSQSIGITHSMLLTDLSANTLYHFRVKSQDAAGNVASSTDYTFRTTATSSINYFVAYNSDPANGTTGLLEHWIRAAWESNEGDLYTNLAADAPGRPGHKAMEVRFGAANAWGAIGLSRMEPDWTALYPMFLNQFKTIEFDIQFAADSTGEDNLSFLVDEAGYGTERGVATFIPGWNTMTSGQKYGNWFHVTIDLSGFNATMMSFYRFFLYNYGDGGVADRPHFYLANVKLGWLTDATAPTISNVSVTPSLDYRQLSFAWNTDEPTTYRIDYGTTASYGSSVVGGTTDGDYATSSAANVTGLTPGVNYFYRITATDHQFLASDPRKQKTYTGTYSMPATPTTPPTISNLLANVDGQSINMTWTTDRPSVATIGYKKSGGALITQNTTNYVTSHSVLLDILEPLTTYIITVTSTDAFGNRSAQTVNATTTSGGTPDVTISINPAQTMSISPYIYGVNWNDDAKDTPSGVTLNRQGGNRWTAYNWENNASNAGSDYYYQSDDYLGGGTTPAESVRQKIAIDRANNQATLMTVQMQGYVSADKNGQTNPSGADRATRFKTITFKKGSAFTENPSTTDATVYIDEFAWALNQKIPGIFSATATHPVLVDLDNEPELWPTTHSEIQTTTPISSDAYMTKTLALMRALKDQFPNIVLLGPVHYGFMGLYNWQDESGAGFTSTNWFTDKYLQAVAQASQSDGRRLLDAYDFHWYSEAQSSDGSRIIDLTSSNLTDDQMQAIVQSPRSLWDPTYSENSWVSDVVGGPINILGTIQDKIDASYPGTKIAISEYDNGGDNNIAGAVAQADNLGIFGSHGVFEASWWPYTNSYPYIMGAFSAYRGFDGASAHFGDVSLKTASSDVSKVVVYASSDSSTPGRNVYVAINRSSSSQKVLLNGQTFSGNAYVYRISASSGAAQLAANQPVAPVFVGQVPVNGNSFFITLPAYSVSTIEVR